MTTNAGRTCQSCLPSGPFNMRASQQRGVLMKTKSEGLFEGFLTTNNLPFEKIEVDTTPRPDYRVSVGGGEIIFELKELAEDENSILSFRTSARNQWISPPPCMAHTRSS